MLVLGIETSCDETSVAILKSKDTKNAEILSSCIFSQADIHSVFGGVVPEVASRNHMQKILPVFNKAINEAKVKVEDINLIAVTSFPGLVGALFVGVSFAKGLGYSLKKPVFPVHHLSGHILSSELSNPELRPPYVAIVISGGHTHIYDVHLDDDDKLIFNLYGRTIDDAAGEAFDKVAIMLGGKYPGGPYIDKLAQSGNKNSIKFPIALKDSPNFSFSGLKTSVMNRISTNKESKENIAASFQYTVCNTIIDKVIEACKKLGRESISVSGGVACNSMLRTMFSEKTKDTNLKCYFPEISICNDNAAMIAYAGLRITSGKNIDIFQDYNFAVGDTAHNIDVK